MKLTWAAVLLLPSLAWGNVAEYTANAGAEWLFGRTWTITTNGASEVWFRHPLPLYGYADETNRFVTSAYGVWTEPVVPMEQYEYNVGTVNQGVWLRIHTAGVPTVKVTVALQQTVSNQMGPMRYQMEQYQNAPYTYPTAFIDNDNPALASKAHELMMGSGSVYGPFYWSAVERFVDFIAQKYWDPRGTAAGSWPTASQVLYASSVDCVGASLLFCGLCRAVGIPARPVYVMAFDASVPGCPLDFPGNGGHMMAEYWTGDDWVPVDPNATTGFVSPSRAWLAAQEDVADMTEVLDPLDGAALATTYQFQHQQVGTWGGYSRVRSLPWPQAWVRRPYDTLSLGAQNPFPVDRLTPVEVTGAAETTAHNALRVLPNPAPSMSTILQGPQLVGLRVFNVRGATVVERDFEPSTSVQLDLPEPGAYFGWALTEAGERLPFRVVGVR
jgi:transglutaminase-like putative cysteine protease